MSRTLTDDDVKAIVDEMKKMGLVHVCRYDIDPEDMGVLMEFVRTVRRDYIEARGIVRRFIIKLVLWILAGALLIWLGDRIGGFKQIAKGFLHVGP